MLQIVFQALNKIFSKCGQVAKVCIKWNPSGHRLRLVSFHLLMENTLLRYVLCKCDIINNLN